MTRQIGLSVSWLPACQTTSGYRGVFSDAELYKQDRRAMVNVHRVLHFSGIQRLACRAISASAELLLQSIADWPLLLKLHWFDLLCPLYGRGRHKAILQSVCPSVCLSHFLILHDRYMTAICARRRFQSIRKGAAQKAIKMLSAGEGISFFCAIPSWTSCMTTCCTTKFEQTAIAYTQSGWEKRDFPQTCSF